MMTSWVWGLLRHRTAHLLGSVAGVAVAVAILASIGAFLGTAQAQMTARAASNVPVDWQIAVAAGTDSAAAVSTIAAADGVTAAAPVQYSTATGLRASTGGSTQTTGAAVILGLPAHYATTFPGELRLLTGTLDGVLIAQQTASFLHVAVGDMVQLEGKGEASVKVAGIVDLPQANSLFQTVGAAPSAQPTAPPDNVVLLPTGSFATVQQTLGTAAVTQVHVRLDHVLPADPAQAYVQVTQSANHLAATLAGSGIVGDNLAASLDASRSDASYARLLFLFLGLPGAVIAALLTIAVAGAGAAGRRRDQALLRLRGAGAGTLTRLAFAEAAIVAVGGAAVGLGAAALISAFAFGSPLLASGWTEAGSWIAAAVGAGVLISTAAIVIPAARDARGVTVVGARRHAEADRAPLWQRIWLDVILLVTGIAVFIVTTQNGYSLVLAPEGVATINVNYVAFVGPALFWTGAGMLSWRLARLLLARRRVVGALARPFTGRLAPIAAASFGRQRNALAWATVLLSLSLAFAASTAVFNSTYAQQAEVDARLTNGSDVHVVTRPASPDPAKVSATLSAIPGVAAVEPMQHRFAYVGADLQDLFGVSPTTIGASTSLQDAYFQGGTAAQLMRTLGATPDGLLVSAETVTDYQLTVGDTVSLRLVDPRSQQPITVPFRYIGVALEFPTAPKDSFFVANADYITHVTGDGSVSDFLIATNGRAPAQVAAAASRALGTAATVTPISVVRSTVGSSLTSVNLEGLTTLELGFALVLGAASGGLVLMLRLRDRRTTFAIAGLMGAGRRQLRGLVLAEGVVVALPALLLGTVLGAALSGMLVAVLTGVFDPPPSELAVPWLYLAGVAAIAVAAMSAVAFVVARRSRRPPVEVLRDR